MQKIHQNKDKSIQNQGIPVKTGINETSPIVNSK